MRPLALLSAAALSCAGPSPEASPPPPPEPPTALDTVLPYIERTAPLPFVLSNEAAAGSDAGAVAPGVPVISSLTPSTGGVASGTPVLVRGSGFGPTTKVYLGVFSRQFAVPAIVLPIDSERLLVITPPFFPGVVDVAVINSASEYATRPGGFTYADPSVPQKVMNPPLPPGDGFALLSAEVNRFDLYPALAESTRDTHFQFVAARTALTPPQAVAGRFDGQPGDTVGLYDSRAKRFHLGHDNATTAVAPLQLELGEGAGSWLPLAGDFDSDGTDTVGVYNPATREFVIKSTPAPGPGDVRFTFGTGGAFSQPLAGDFDGDGIDTVGTYDRLTGRVELRSGPTLTWDTGLGVQFAPVVGDWNGDGIDSIGFFDLATQQLHVFDAVGPGTATRVVQYAPSTFMRQPLAGRFRASATPAPTAGFAWPTATPAQQRIDAAKLLQAYAVAAQLPNLRSLLVVRNGQLVGEAYLHGATGDTGYDIKSVSKSMLSALYGIAYRDGVLPDMTAPISRYLPPSYFPVGQDPRKAQIQLAHLLTMSGGLQYSENDIGSNFYVTQDWVQGVLAPPMAADAGTAWNYSTGLTTIAGRVLTEASGRDLAEYADEKLLRPLGIEAVRWDRDPMGYRTGGLEVFMKARDIARFGQLYLQRGSMGGQQLVPAQWVDATTRPLFPTHISGRGYGGWWWTQRIAGHDAYFGLGYGGQWLLIVPSLQLVVVATSKSDVLTEIDGLQDTLIWALFEQYVVPAVMP